MPTPEEIEKLAGENPAAATENPDVQKTPEVVSIDEFRSVVEQKEEAVKFAKRRDNEIHTLRKRVEELEGGSIVTPRKSETPVVDEEDDELIARIRAAGFAPKSEVRAEVQAENILAEKTRTLQSDMASASQKYPFINQSELLEYMKGKGDITVDEAVKLKYEKELSTLKNNPEIPETDTSRRTIAVDVSKPIGSSGEEKAAPYAMGPRNASAGFRGFVADSLAKAAERMSGNN